jgi:hypothetical protein
MMPNNLQAYSTVLNAMKLIQNYLLVMTVHQPKIFEIASFCISTLLEAVFPGQEGILEVPLLDGL